MTLRRKRHQSIGLERQQELAGYGFVLPGVLFLLAFVAYPMISNLAISLQDLKASTITSGAPFIGFDNYRKIVRTSLFQKAFLNTLFFTAVTLLGQFVIGFLLALFFAKPFPGCKFFRGLLLVCWVLPHLVRGTIWRWMFAGDGVFNYLLMKIGIIKAPILWLAQGNMAMITLITTQTWLGVPFIMLLLVAGLTTLPREIYEVARIDGARRSQQFLHVTLPLLKPTIISVLTVGVIYTYKVFELVYIMTGGGPSNSTELLATLAYKETFLQFSFGRGAAVSNILFAVLLLAGLGFTAITNREEAS